MFRLTVVLCCVVAVISVCLPTVSSAVEIRGSYLEARTCDVYTGPCFANGEVGISGKDAIMAWNIQLRVRLDTIGKFDEVSERIDEILHVALCLCFDLSRFQSFDLSNDGFACLDRIRQT